MQLVTAHLGVTYFTINYSFVKYKIRNVQHLANNKAHKLVLMELSRSEIKSFAWCNKDIVS